MPRLIDPLEQLFDSAGNPLVKGKLWFYTSGSSTIQKDTFANSAETITNTNPVEVGGDGRVPNVFGTGTYRVILTDSDDAQILQRDPIGGDSGITFGADWISTQVYGINDVARDAGEYWVSLISSNQNIRPSTDGGSNWVRWPDDILNAAIVGGTIDGAVIGGTTPAAGSFTTADIDGGTADNMAIGATTPGTGDFTTIGATAPGSGQFTAIGSTAPGTGDFTTLTADTPPLSDGHISGLIGSQAADTDHDITISTGAARDSTGAYDLRLASAMTKQLDNGTWVAGTDQPGLDAGAPANNTEYWYFLIRKDSDASIDVLISASYASPTMPTGYTYRSLPVHWVLTDGSSNIIAHEAIESAGGGVRYQWDSPVLDVNQANTLTTTARNDALSVLTGKKVSVNINALIYDAASSALVYISDPDTTDLAPSVTATPLSTMFSTTANRRVESMGLMTNTSGEIRARASIATVDEYRVATIGFEWSRR